MGLQAGYAPASMEGMAVCCPELYNSADRCDDWTMYTHIMLLTFGSVFHEQAFLAQGTQSSDQHTRQTAQ